MTNLPTKTESRINYDLFTHWDTSSLKENFEYMLAKTYLNKEDTIALPLVRQHLLERGEVEWVKEVHWEITEMKKEGVL